MDGQMDRRALCLCLLLDFLTDSWAPSGFTTGIKLLCPRVLSSKIGGNEPPCLLGLL